MALQMAPMSDDELRRRMGLGTSVGINRGMSTPNSATSRFAPAPGSIFDANKGGYYTNTNSSAPTSGSNLAAPYKLANSAITQGADDYSDLMKGYKDIIERAKSMPLLSAPTLNPEMTQYAPSADYTGAVANLKALSQNGGYTDSDINSLRERAISPIRSIYAGANRDVDRQRALQGGYSPNYSAVKAKMAREESDSIGNQMTNVNAGLADRIAQGRLGIAPTLASITSNENTLRNNIAGHNTDTANQFKELNANLPLTFGSYNRASLDELLRAMEGMRGLYGTTPALAQLFGSQALSQAQLNELINSHNNEQGLQLVSSMIPGLRR